VNRPNKPHMIIDMKNSIPCGDKLRTYVTNVKQKKYIVRRDARIHRDFSSPRCGRMVQHPGIYF
jgi:hypothetical protein